MVAASPVAHPFVVRRGQLLESRRCALPSSRLPVPPLWGPAPPSRARLPSPSGAIAFVSARGGPSPGVYTIDAGGGHVQRDTTSFPEVFRGAVSPAGTHVALSDARDT